jgi:hypothetical protein
MAASAVDEEGNGRICTRVMQPILVFLSLFAFLLGLASIYDCEFLFIKIPAPVDRTVAPNNSNNASTTITTTDASPTSSLLLEDEDDEPRKVSLGLFRYQDSYHPLTCYAYDDETGPFPSAVDGETAQFYIARWSASISASFGILAFVVLVLEICCCRFPCSRVLVHGSILVAMFAIPPIFAVYTSGLCNIFSDTSHECQLGNGATLVFIAFFLFLGTLIASCITPKARPLSQILLERETKSVQDPCCCYGWKQRTTEGEVDEEKPQEKVLSSDNAPSLEEEVLDGEEDLRTGIDAAAVDETSIQPATSKKGLFFSKKTPAKQQPSAAASKESLFAMMKQYMDDQEGGMTLQSQYKVASRRWLECEKNYETVLDRFKQECQDASTEQAEKQQESFGAGEEQITTGNYNYTRGEMSFKCHPKIFPIQKYRVWSESSKRCATTRNKPNESWNRLNKPT